MWDAERRVRDFPGPRKPLHVWRVGNLKRAQDQPFCPKRRLLH
jgi:hypothetical protein